jgi:hypothetical protein
MSVRPGTTLYKDPQDVLPYVFDFAAFLGTGVAIDSHSIAISGNDSALENEDDDTVEADTGVQVMLSGGTVGLTYTVTCHIVTDETPAREKDVSFKLKIQPQ